MDFLKTLKFDENGLILAIVQDIDNGQVLMVAYMNEECIRKTVKAGRTCFWSRERDKFWWKGEISGHLQKVQEIYVDCDGDALLIKVKQSGGACHKGYRSCFYRLISEDGGLKVIGEKVFEPEEVYGAPENK